jgi:flagellar M-ring protein FliF
MAGDSSPTSQIQQVLQNMTTPQKGVVVALTLTVLLALVGFGVWASQDSMGILFSNLPPTDANRIVEDLRKQNVKYDLSQDQRTISVPEPRVGELRLKYAGEGLPKGENIGFEKLETPSLTTTDFTQKIMYRRAMEAQLAKTLRDGLSSVVADATVHITAANDSPFVTEKEDAKASVLLKLKGTRPLPDDNTQAIVNLVAASVEGLKPEHVVVVDQFSRILSRGGQDPLVGASDTQKKLQREEEEHLVRRITELLEPVVGLGKVRATAHVDLDFDKVKTSEEKFDPQGQVERKVQQKDENTTKREGSSGAPGTPSNLPPATGATGGGTNSETTVKKDVTTDYEISKSLTTTERALGGIKRLSLAVVVDDATSWDTSGKEPVAKRAPRTAEELKKLRDQVAAAVGIQEAPPRRDQLTVENIAFAAITNPKEEADARKQWWVEQGKALVPYAIWSILGMVAFFMVVMPMLKKLSSALNRPAPLKIHGEGEPAPRKITQVKSMSELQAEIEAELNAEGVAGAPEAQRRQLIKKRIQETAFSDPETTAQLVRSWMAEDGR